MNKNMRFVCACRAHGVETHDGTKNECCDTAVILPMLSNEDREKLVPEGQKHYLTDMRKLADLVESHAVSIDELPDVQDWYKDVGFPLVEAEIAADQQTPEIEDDDQKMQAPEEEEQRFDPQYYYMLGFTEGFPLGYEKGYDAGNRLSVLSKK